MRCGLRAAACGPAQEEFWPAAAGPSGLYRQEKLLLRGEYLEALEKIKGDFASRKPDFRKSVTLGQLVDAAIGLMLRQVDFASLESAEDLERHVVRQVLGCASCKEVGLR
jgi:hypothetical protein